MTHTQSIYESGAYLAKNPTWHAEDSAWKAHHIESILKANHVAPSSVVEIGCGAGEILNSLSRLLTPGVRFVGYEVSPQAYSICRLKTRAGLEFHLADALAEPTPRFDVALAIDVFEHVEDYVGFIKRLRLKAEHKVFHIPLDVSVQSVLRGTLLTSREAVGHLHYFTKETALATLTDAGYSIVDYRYTAGANELPNREWKSKLLRVPRELLFSINRGMAVRILGGYSLLVLAK